MVGLAAAHGEHLEKLCSMLADGDVLVAENGECLRWIILCQSLKGARIIRTTCKPYASTAIELSKLLQSWQNLIVANGLRK